MQGQAATAPGEGWDRRRCGVPPRSGPAAERTAPLNHDTTLPARVARECRETSTLIYTRSRFLKDHLAALMNLVCRCDAVVERLAALAGPEGERVRQNLEVAMREVDRDGILGEMMQLLERSANDAVHLEQLSLASEALAQSGERETDLALWFEEVAAEMRRLPEGRVTVDWAVDGRLPRVEVAGALFPVLTGVLRGMAEASTASCLLTLRAGAAAGGVDLEISLERGTPRSGKRSRWNSPPAGAWPVLVEVARRLLEEGGGDLDFETPQDALAGDGCRIRARLAGPRVLRTGTA